MSVKLQILTALALLSGVVGLVALQTAPVAAQAVDIWQECSGRNDPVCRAARNDDAAVTIAQRVIQVLLWAIGAVAVIMIVLGGLRYTTSNGNAEQIKAAKNTIMYAIIGLVVAIMGQAIVTFVVTNFR